MKTIFASMAAMLLLVSALHAQRDVTRQNTAPIGTDVIIQDVNTGEDVDGVILYDRNTRLTDDYAQNRFIFIGVDGIPNTIAFRAYPNPVVDNMWIEVAGPEFNFYVTLYDVQGRAIGIREQSIAGFGRWESSFNLSDLAPGAYILAFTDAEGNRLGAQRIIKHY